MTYQEALAYLESLQVFGIKLGLERIQRLLELLDVPQVRYRTVHVTGTNGKGSTSAMIARILRQAGLRVGLYTSPHLSSYTERIRLDAQPIGEQEFADCLSTIKFYAEKMVAEGEECPTQFEVLTALALFFFAMKHVDYAVVEVGLGGLLDSTNIITPEVSVITNVALEHADRCGGTLAGVAEHKAGIIKAGVPVVTAAEGLPLEIIRRKAEEMNADVFVLGQDFTVERLGFEEGQQKIRFHSDLLGTTDEASLRLLGAHQAVNAGCAMMAAAWLHNMEAGVTKEVVAEALRLVNWPARFEMLQIGEQQIIIDGAHNPTGARALRESLDEYFPAKERVFLLGILRDKAVEEILAGLLRPNDTVVVTRPDSKRAAAPEELARMAAGKAQHVESYADKEEALHRALELSNSERLLIATGSLYLVGALREEILRKGRDEANG